MKRSPDQPLCLTGPAGSLPLRPDDLPARKFAMLAEGECLAAGPIAAAQKDGYSKQRYYQLLHQFNDVGSPALLSRKPGPKRNYRRTESVIEEVIRLRYLDPDASPEVIAQKLRQCQHKISTRSVQRIIAQFGLQKKGSTSPVASHHEPASKPRAPKTAPGRSRATP